MISIFSYINDSAAFLDKRLILLLMNNFRYSTFTDYKNITRFIDHVYRNPKFINLIIKEYLDSKNSTGPV